MPENNHDVLRTIKRAQKILEFKELRSGKNTAFLLWKVIQYNKFSGGRFSSHLVDYTPSKLMTVELYDYDLKILILLLIILLFKGIK